MKKKIKSFRKGAEGRRRRRKRKNHKNKRKRKMRRRMKSRRKMRTCTRELSNSFIICHVPIFRSLEVSWYREAPAQK